MVIKMADMKKTSENLPGAGDSRPNEILRKIDEITRKQIFVEEYNNYVRENVKDVDITDIDTVACMTDEHWQKLYDEAYEKNDRTIKKKLRDFKAYQPNPDCIPIRVRKEFLTFSHGMYILALGREEAKA